MDERKKKFKRRLIFLIVFIGVIIAAIFTRLQRSVNEFFVQRTKNESTVTKTFTTDELRQIENKQRELFYRYSGEAKTRWLYEEIKHGAYTMFKTATFMSEHPEYDLAKIKFKVTKYKVDGKTVEFMSKSTITQLHSKSGWKDK